MVFDTCCHTGGTIKTITRVLDKVGFTDIRIITASSPGASSGITPACVIESGIIKSCCPFGCQDIVERRSDSIISRRCSSSFDRILGLRERDEIKRLIHSKGR